MFSYILVQEPIIKLNKLNMKNLKLLSLLSIFLVFFTNCSSDDENDSPENPSTRENSITINQQTFETTNGHLFIYEDDNEVDIILSNNSSDDWFSFEGNIQVFEFSLNKTDITGTYTFLPESDADFNSDSNFPYALSAITTIQDGVLNDTNEEGTGIIETWYDTDNGSLINENNNIVISNIEENIYEIEYSISIDGNEITGYYQGELISIVE